MKSECALLVALSLASIMEISAPAYGQRHGRADGVQTYARSVPPPELHIQWTSRHELDRWRASDLEAIDAVTVVVPLSKHSARQQTISGARLRDLFVNRGAGEPGLLEVHYGFFQKKTLHWQELDPDQTIVASRWNGNRLQDAVWLVAVDTHGRSITLKAVSKVVVKPQSH
jgi:hypothetical protein